MSFFIIILLFIIIRLSIFIYNLKQDLKIKIEKDEQIIKINQELEEQKRKLYSEINFSEQLLNKAKSDLNDAQLQITSMENISKDAYIKYCDLLDDNYNQKEKEYDSHVQRLKNAYNELQEKKLTEINDIQKHLDTIKNTRAAAIEALRKEKQIKENKEFYCLPITAAELSDIKLLSKIKEQLNKPRILSMLIWSTYYQKSMTQLCNNILGLNAITGIYKITNLTDDYCYIGQAVDVRKKMERPC